MFNRRLNVYSPEEFSGVFKKYWEFVYSICLHYVKEEALASDMVQEIFATVWNRKQRLENEEALERYLARAAKFQVYKYYRDLRKSMVDTTAFDEEIVVADNADPYMRIACKDEFEQYEAKLALLKEPAQTIFRMSRYQALSHKEIARRMGITVKAVEYHLTKAFRFIRGKELG